MNSVEKSSHIHIFLLLFRFFNLLFDFSGSGGGSSSGLLLGTGSLGSFKGSQFISSFKGQGGNILESIHDHMGNSRFDGISTFHRKGGKVSNTTSEKVHKASRVKVEHRFGEHGSIIINLENIHTIAEGLDVHFFQKVSFGGGHLLSSGKNLNFLHDFNGTLDDLGGDREGMEEGNLRGVHTSGSCRDNHFALGNISYFGNSFTTVIEDDRLEVKHCFIGEDHTELSNHQFLEFSKLRNSGTILDKILIEFAILGERIDFQVKGDVDLSSFSDHQFGLVSEKISTDQLHLVRTNIVEGNHNDSLISGEVFVDLLDELGFLGSCVTHINHLKIYNFDINNL